MMFKKFAKIIIHRVTGFASAKVGRLAAFTIGGAIILLEVANEQGIIKIDWSRLYRKVDEAGDKVQETLGQGPKWVDKVSFFNTLLACIFLHRVSIIFMYLRYPFQNGKTMQFSAHFRPNIILEKMYRLLLVFLEDFY